MTKKRKTEDAMRVFRIVKNIIFISMMVLLVFAISATMIAKITGGTPKIFGHSLYRVSTGSMEPTLKVGDIILVKECEDWDLLEGDIITFNGKKGSLEGKIVTHRIVKAPYKEGEEKFLVTKGDANSISDDPISVGDVVGKMVSKIDFLRTIYDIFITPWGLLIMIALILLAFSNEIVIFVRALLGYEFEGKKKKDSVEDIIARYQTENSFGENNRLSESAEELKSDDLDTNDKE